MTDNDIKKMIPTEVLDLRESNQLHKLAELRTGSSDFGLDTAVSFIAKKAFYQRQVNKAIAASINALDHIK